MLLFFEFRFLFLRIRLISFAKLWTRSEIYKEFIAWRIFLYWRGCGCGLHSWREYLIDRVYNKLNFEQPSIFYQVWLIIASKLVYAKVFHRQKHGLTWHKVDPSSIDRATSPRQRWWLLLLLLYGWILQENSKWRAHTNKLLGSNGIIVIIIGYCTYAHLSGHFITNDGVSETLCSVLRFLHCSILVFFIFLFFSFSSFCCYQSFGHNSPLRRFYYHYRSET